MAMVELVAKINGNASGFQKAISNSDLLAEKFAKNTEKKFNKLANKMFSIFGIIKLAKGVISEINEVANMPRDELIKLGVEEEDIRMLNKVKDESEDIGIIWKTIKIDAITGWMKIFGAGGTGGGPKTEDLQKKLDDKKKKLLEVKKIMGEINALYVEEQRKNMTPDELRKSLWNERLLLDKQAMGEKDALKRAEIAKRIAGLDVRASEIKDPEMKFKRLKIENGSLSEIGALGRGAGRAEKLMVDIEENTRKTVEAIRQTGAGLAI